MRLVRARKIGDERNLIVHSLSLDEINWKLELEQNINETDFTIMVNTKWQSDSVNRCYGSRSQRSCVSD